MRKLAAFLSFILLFTAITVLPPAYALYQPRAVEDGGFDIYSKSVYLYNLDTGETLCAMEEHTPTQPASTAKIMTCLLALENTADLDEPFVYPTYIFDMVPPGSAQADVRIGEEMTMRKALYCLMLQSDCYSAMAIADRIGGGDIAAFVEMMNKKAAELGAQNTVFTNPHGLFDENMHTTAYDMFLISKYAYSVENFMDICSMVTVDIGPTNKHPGKYMLYSTISTMIKNNNYYYEPIQGMKTGTLEETGRNYISVASKDGYTYLLVLLGAPYNPENRAENLSFIDAKNFYIWAFSSFASTKLVEKGNSYAEIPVRLSKEADKVRLVASADFSALVPIEYMDPESGVGIQLVPHIPDYLDAQVERGKQVGTMDILLSTEVIGTVNLLAEKDVPRSQILYIMDYLKGLFQATWIKVVLVLVALVLAAYISLMVLRNRYRNRRRRARGRR